MTRHTAILTNMLLSLPLAAGLLCATSSASAQTAETVTIPFAFTADHQQFPAGNYRIKLLSSYILSLGNIGTAKSELVMVRPDDGGGIETRGRLIFQRTGTEYSLTQVRIPGTSLHSELAVQPKLQQASARNTQQTGSFVEVAFK